MSRLKELEEKAIARLQAFEPDSESLPYYIAYSGGKDSDTVRILAELSGVRYELHHNLTTVDAPETVYYVRSIPDVIIHRPKKTMWQLIPEKLMPPTRMIRYCCSELKERGGEGRRVVTGVLRVKNETPRRYHEDKRCKCRAGGGSNRRQPVSRPFCSFLLKFPIAVTKRRFEQEE